MHQPDYDNFRTLLDDVAATLPPGDRKLLSEDGKPTDLVVQRYWNALKDLPFEVVKSRAALHLKRSRFWPKPAELRPPMGKPKAEADPAEKRRYDGAARFNDENWKRQLAKDRLHTEWLLLDAYLARTQLMAPDDLLLEERMGFARQRGQHLLAECGGDEIIHQDLAAWRVAIQLWPQKAANAAPMAGQRELAAPAA